MNFTPNNDFGDRRLATAKDDEINRKIAIQNIKREEKESKAIWFERQLELYPQGLVVSNVQSLQEVIIDENNQLIKDEEFNYNKALSSLLHLADKTTGQYILDRLSTREIFAMNQMWNAVMLRVKKNYTTTGLDKDVFISMVKSLNDPFYDNHQDTEDLLSDRGRNRLLEETEKGEKIQINIDAQRAMDTLKEQSEIKTGQAVLQRKKDDDEKNQSNSDSSRASHSREQTKNLLETTMRNRIEFLKGQQKTNTADGLARNVLPNDTNTFQSPPKKAKSLGNKNKLELQEYAVDLTGDMKIIFDPITQKPLTKKQLIEAIYNFTGKTPEKGNGLKITKRQRVIVGGGFTIPTKNAKRTIGNKKLINGKYIDLGKLKDDILVVRYVSTGAYLPNLKAQSITKGSREVIEDILGGKFDERLYKKLTADERRVIKRFVSVLKLDINVKDDDDIDFSKKYQILLGEFAAGNTNPEVKNQLKKYVVEAIAQNKIPKHQGYSLLFQLSV